MKSPSIVEVKGSMPPAGFVESTAALRCNLSLLLERKSFSDYATSRMSSSTKHKMKNGMESFRGEATEAKKEAVSAISAFGAERATNADTVDSPLQRAALTAERATAIALVEHKQRQRRLLAIETEQIFALQQQEQLALLQQRQEMVDLEMRYPAALISSLNEVERTRQQQALFSSSMHGLPMHHPHIYSHSLLGVGHAAGPLANNMLPLAASLGQHPPLVARDVHTIPSVSMHNASLAAEKKYLSALALQQGHKPKSIMSFCVEALEGQARKYANEAKKPMSESSLRLVRNSTSATKSLIESYSLGGTKEPPFPLKLHAILSNRNYEDLIVWLPSGKSWRILNPLAFEKIVIPHYFRHAKYASFMRQVNGWGFKRTLHGVEHNSYFHELFIRGDPELCFKMKRVGATRNAAGEPVEQEPSSDEESKSKKGAKDKKTIETKTALVARAPKNESKTAGSANEEENESKGRKEYRS